MIMPTDPTHTKRQHNMEALATNNDLAESDKTEAVIKPTALPLDSKLDIIFLSMELFSLARHRFT